MEPSPSLYYLALDQALANCGWAAFKITDYTIESIECGVIKTTAQQDLVERVCQVETGVAQLIEQYRPKLVFTEKVFKPRNRPAAWELLVRVEAVLHNLLFKLCLDYRIISAGSESKSWRRILRVPRHKQAAKEFVLANLQEKLNRVPNEHMADACAIGVAALIIEGVLPEDLIDSFYVERPNSVPDSLVQPPGDLAEVSEKV